MKTDITLPVFTAPRADSTTWKQEAMSWSRLVTWAATPANVKESGGYVIGTFRGHQRRNTSLVSRSALTLDADYHAGDLPHLVAQLGVAALVHSTFSSTEANPRYRLIIPLSQPVSAETYAALAEAIAVQLDPSMFDRTSFRPTQFMWRPATADPKTYTWREYDGPLLNPNTFVYPTAQAIDAARTGPRHRRKRDPLTAPGVVGVFNREYADFSELVATFDLPYDHDEDDRWRYRGTTSMAGMGPVVGMPGVYFSHHASDPASGRACSAFDLVRIHRFGDEDWCVKADTPINRYPSQGEMMKLAAKDPKVKAALAAEESGGSDDLDNAWRAQLDRSPKTGRIFNTPANRRLIRENDEEFTCLAYNQQRTAVVIVGRDRMPWDTAPRLTDELNDLDIVALQDVMNDRYGTTWSKNDIRDMALLAAMRRMVNPVRDYLEALVWDGVPRLETCLPATPTPYTALVARKVLCGAVARALDPGCKTDFALVLQGPQGIGKTRWVHAMGRERRNVASLGRIGDKDTLIAMQGAWIMLSDETDALNRAAFDRLKAFMTETHDVYRAPFDRTAVERPRRSVIWATTNDPKFLAKQEGNRRFLAVACGQADNDKLTDDYIDQVWAEAVFLWQVEGELLYMTDEEEALAAAERTRFTHIDPLWGQVRGYLEMAVPLEWDAMGINDRAAWVAGESLVQTDATEHINVACVASVWAEVLGRNGQPLTEIQGRKIEAALMDAPGWAPAGEVVLPLYGPQQAFVREDLL